MTRSRELSYEESDALDDARARSVRGVPQADRVRACLLGGAVGDALGAPIEFLSLEEIRRRYGPDGIQEFDVAYGRVGAITDDTQMAMFTAEGLLRALSRINDRGVCDPPSVIYRAYLRWLQTQGDRVPDLQAIGCDPGWLVSVRELHSRRAPGITCLAALRSGRMGTVDEPINASKGCGTVMRVAPVGLMPESHDPFELGRDSGAITHGHPSGYLAAGAMAVIVRVLVAGGTLDAATSIALDRLRLEPDSAEVVVALERALRMTTSGVPPLDAVHALGKGAVAEEALAIAVYCATVAHGDFERGVRLAVNHSGDSDSTGAIAGNILGAQLGMEATPERWLAQLELRDVLETLAADLLTGWESGQRWAARYPPN